MKKLNYKNIFLFIIMLISVILFIKDWVIVLVKGASFTWFGLISNITFLGVASFIYEYLEEYTQEKEERKKRRIKNERKFKNLQ